MQRYVSESRERSSPHGRVAIGAILFGLLCAATPALAASVSAAAVMGVVRDAQGVGQMGALVQVLAADSATVATAFTDLHGHYVIKNLVPGMYQVRASATLFVPATRGNLQLRTGARAVVNLTLAALFDTTQWLPAERRRADEPADDWRWTLRSSANRPILRILDDGSVVLTSSTEAPGNGSEMPRLTVFGGDGGFGGGGVRTSVSMNRDTGHETEMLLRAKIGTPVSGAGYAAPAEVAAGYEKALGVGGTARTMVSYRSHPELIAPDGTYGVDVLNVSGAQAMSLGDLLDMEVGGALTAVHTDSADGFVGTPYLRLTAHPAGGWTIRYELATSRDLQGVDDVNPEGELPAAAISAGRLLQEQGRHQEIAITRKAGRGVIEVAVFHDGMDRLAINGVGTSAPVAGMTVDPSTGSFRMLAAGYSGQGTEMMVSTPLPSGIRITAQYSFGAAMSAGELPNGAFGFKPGYAQSGTVALKGRIRGPGTSVRAMYRWQPGRMVTAVNPYGAFSDQGYLSFSMRQPLHWGNHLPPGLDATIDVTNLLEQGYRPYLSADGQTLYFAQAPRTMQAGLSFSF